MNIYDVAKEAGVSIATVSRVINNKGYVSEKTRQKIEAVLAKSEYQPSAIARGLAMGSMKTVAIFAVDVRVPHYAMTSFIIEQKLSKLGYMVVLCNTGEDPENWKRYLRTMMERKIDGIIMTGSIYNRLDGDSVLETTGEIPIVLANGRLGRENCHSVIVDEGRGIELAAEHLYKRGHRRLAYVADKDTESGERKMGGFIRQMKLLGADSPERDVYETEYGLDGGSSIALKLHAKGYDGLVFGEDLTAVGAMNELLRIGVDIPGEIAITGCNNSEYSYVCRPALTTVNNKGNILADLTSDLLVDLIEKRKETAELVIMPELVVRETS
ncbi:MAG: LacI family DNA-binding transcriptional regulator [Lachnospiraceae bacterium]|nr:LacI family DNA-binding transcriptional regulator [Lachnospiraceae bacterium]